MFLHSGQFLLLTFVPRLELLCYILIYVHPIKKFTNNVLNLPGVKQLVSKKKSIEKHLKAHFLR